LHQKELQAALKATAVERERVYSLPGTEHVFRELLLFKPNVIVESTRRTLTPLDLSELTAAVNAYYLLHNEYPPTLDIWLKRGAGVGIPILEAKSLTAPWGRRYVYAPTQRHPETGTPLIYSQGQRPGDPSDRLSNWVGAAKK